MKPINYSRIRTCLLLCTLSKNVFYEDMQIMRLMMNKTAFHTYFISVNNQLRTDFFPSHFFVSVFNISISNEIRTLHLKTIFFFIPDFDKTIYLIECK